MTKALDDKTTAPKKLRRRMTTAPAADATPAVKVTPAGSVAASVSPATEASAALKPRQTRRDQLVALLRGDGADIAAISAAFGWLPHSSRAALTGLRKAGFALEKTTPEDGGGAIYRIADDPATARVAATTAAAAR